MRTVVSGADACAYLHLGAPGVAPPPSGGGDRLKG